MKIAITSPIYVNNQMNKKYLDFTTQSIQSKENELIWVPHENYVHPDYQPLTYKFTQPISEIRTLQSEKEQSVAKAWNTGIDEGIKAGAKYILVINQDIILKPNAIDRLVAFAESYSEATLWSGTEYRDYDAFVRLDGTDGFTRNLSFACFMVKHNFFKQMGYFDENFAPAYFEDGDMCARLALAKKEAYACKGALFFHFGSQTIKNDEKLYQENMLSYPKLAKYFTEKWGHSPVNDFEVMRRTYHKYPYNQANKPLSFWKKVSTDQKERGIQNGY